MHPGLMCHIGMDDVDPDVEADWFQCPAFDCADNEIPVVPPQELKGGSTLGEAGGILFSVFPLRSGRTFDVLHDQDWLRLGAIVGRMHQVGKTSSARERLSCVPEKTTLPYIKELEEAGLIPDDCLDAV